MNKPASKARRLIRFIKYGECEGKDINVDLGFVGYIAGQLLEGYADFDMQRVKRSLFRRLILIAEKINN